METRREVSTCIHFFTHQKHSAPLRVTSSCSGGTQTNTTALREDSSGINSQVRGRRVSSLLVCCLCLSRLLLPWRDRWTPATESSQTIHRDCLEMRCKTITYLVELRGGGTESSSFESFRWKKRPFTVPWQPFLFFQCKNWAEAVAFIFTTLDLADHVFPLLEEESKEDQISF